MKNKLNKIKPIKVQTPDSESGDQLAEFISGLGYNLYEDPLDVYGLIITSEPMTYSDYYKSHIFPFHKNKKLKKNFYDEVKDRMEKELDCYT